MRLFFESVQGAYFKGELVDLSRRKIQKNSPPKARERFEDCHLTPNDRPTEIIAAMQAEGTESAELRPYSSTRKLVDYDWLVHFGSSSFNSSWVSNNDYYAETAYLECN